MQHVQFRRNDLLASLIWVVTASAFIACAPEGDPNYQMPPGLPVVVDAQVGDGGTPPASGGDGGLVTSVDARVPPLDAGPALDAQPTFDAQPILPGEGGALSEASAGEGGVTADAAMPRMDLGKGTGRDVITIGDSWMLLVFTGIQESLVKASGNQPYRKYGFPGTRLLNGDIPNQYTTAKRDDPVIKTVVMTGGGNDIIQNSALEADCAAGGAMCQAQLDKIGMALSDLWAQMSKDGVQDVIHVMYSASAGSGVKDREKNNMMLAEACAAVPPPLRCHLLNTDALISKDDLPDQIHPDEAGYDRIGKAVWELMVKEGMRR